MNTLFIIKFIAKPTTIKNGKLHPISRTVESLSILKKIWL